MSRRFIVEDGVITTTVQARSATPIEFLFFFSFSVSSIICVIVVVLVAKGAFPFH